jgi:hypothetical protein
MMKFQDRSHKRLVLGHCPLPFKMHEVIIVVAKSESCLKVDGITVEAFKFRSAELITSTEGGKVIRKSNFCH